MTDSYNRLALPPGSLIRDYRLIDALGMGGFGIVYLAKNEHLDRTVAIKEFMPAELATRAEGTQVVPLTSDRESPYHWALERFRREAKILWDLSERNPQRSVARVTDFLEAHGTAYMVMHHEEGEPLSTRLDQLGTLPEAQLMSILVPLLDGLDIVHQASVWHRDIKPANILVRDDGSPVLVDFGAAHVDVPGSDRSVMAVFSPAYAAPEQVYGAEEQGPWTDIYSLGATLYRAVTGSAPTNATDRLRGVPCPLAAEMAAKDYSPSLLRGIDAALALRPQDRPQCIADWRRVFWAAPRGAEASSSQDTVILPARTSETRPPSLPGAIGNTPPSIDELTQVSPKTPQPTRGEEDSGGGQGRIWITLGLLALMIAGGTYYWLSQPRLEPPIADATPSPDVSEPFPVVEGQKDPQVDATSSLDVSEPFPVVEGQKAPQVDATSSPDVSEPATAPFPEAVPVAPDPTLILAQVEAATRKFDCAGINAEIGENLGVQLSGYVSSVAAVSRLQRKIQAIDGVSAVNVDGLLVYERPFCEMVGLLGRFESKGPARRNGVQIRMNKEDLLYREGEFVVVTATASRAFDGYLYVDYLDSEGSVLHLLPSPLSPKNAVKAGEEIVLGADQNTADPSAPRYQVAPPHGHNLIVAIASPQPLFESQRPEVEAADAYLPALRQALARVAPNGSRGNVSSRFEFMTTRE